MKRNNWPVEQHGIRPAGPQDSCFYCRSKLGEQHKSGCVIRQRTVVVRALVEYVIDVPEHWDAEDIEFHRNESSWCSGNGLKELAKLDERLEEADACPCNGIVRYEYVREASAEDEKHCAGPRCDELPA